MRNFEYYTPTQVLFGKDTHLQAGSLLKKYGAKKVLIHYGGQASRWWGCSCWLSPRIIS